MQDLGFKGLGSEFNIEVRVCVSSRMYRHRVPSVVIKGLGFKVQGLGFKGLGLEFNI